MYKIKEMNNGAAAAASAEEQHVDHHHADEDALISAVFEPIRLPEVRFAPSPPGALTLIGDAAVSPASTAPNSLAPTPVPPNSARTAAAAAPTASTRATTPTLCAGGDDASAERRRHRKGPQQRASPTIPMPTRRSVRGRQQTPRSAPTEGEEVSSLHAVDFDDDNEEEEKGVEDDDEHYSIHLTAHKDSFECGGDGTNDEGGIPSLLVSGGHRRRHSASSGMSSSGGDVRLMSITPTGTSYTQETGEAMLDTARSIVATLGGTSDDDDDDHLLELEKEAYDDDDDNDDQHNNHNHHFAADANEASNDDGQSFVDDIRRGSSVLSTEFVNNAMANAIRNVSRGSGTISAAAIANNATPATHANKNAKSAGAFQLELDKRVTAINRLSSASSSSMLSSSATDGCGGGGGGGRDVHVRTPLNDPRSPFNPKAYSAFEPDKQEQIRREIGGSTGRPFGGIRRIVDHFQNGQQQRGQQQQEEKKQQQQAMNNNTQRGMMRQNSLQTMQPPSSPTIQIVVEQQRSVADILSQFQQRDFVHPNGDTAMKKSPQAQRPISLGRRSGVGGSGGGGNGGASIWATPTTTSSGVRNKQPAREPAPGSLAAIRKSLGSVPSTPTSVGSVSPTPTASGERNSSPINNNINGGGPPLMPSSPQRASMPKTVSEFYRLWGAAQAATAAVAAAGAKSGGGTGASSSSIGSSNGSPFAAAAALPPPSADRRVTQC